MTFNSPADRAAFIESNIPLVSSRVMQLNYGAHDDDLFQAGCVGLILAIDRFDTENGAAFSSFAVSYIDGHVRTYQCKGNALIKPLKCGSTFFYKQLSSLDAPVGESGDMTLADTLVADVDVESDVLGACYDSLFARLTNTEKQILMMALSGLPQKDIAKIRGCTRANINHIIHKIRKKYEIDKEREKTA